MLEEKLFSAQEAATKVGRSTKWVRELLRERKITHVCLGKRKYIPESSLKGLFKVIEAKK